MISSEASELLGHCAGGWTLWRSWNELGQPAAPTGYWDDLRIDVDGQWESKGSKGKQGVLVVSAAAVEGDRLGRVNLKREADHYAVVLREGHCLLMTCPEVNAFTRTLTIPSEMYI